MMNQPSDVYQHARKTNYISQVSIDCVIFGFHNQQLKVLVLKFKNSDVYALPGGFIRNDEDIDAAAARVLWERAGVKDIYLEQFATFGKVGRNNPALSMQLLEAAGKPLRENHWIYDRFLSIGYYALVKREDYNIKAGFTASASFGRCRWCPIRANGWPKTCCKAG